MFIVPNKKKQCGTNIYQTVNTGYLRLMGLEFWEDY